MQVAPEAQVTEEAEKKAASPEPQGSASEQALDVAPAGGARDEQ